MTRQQLQTTLQLEVLNAARLLGDTATSYSIWKRLLDVYGDRILALHVHQALDFLETHNFVTTVLSNPTPERGNFRNRTVSITAKGLELIELRRA